MELAASCGFLMARGERESLLLRAHRNRLRRAVLDAVAAHRAGFETEPIGRRNVYVLAAHGRARRAALARYARRAVSLRTEPETELRPSLRHEGEEEPERADGRAPPLEQEQLGDEHQREHHELPSRLQKNEYAVERPERPEHEPDRADKAEHRELDDKGRDEQHAEHERLRSDARASRRTGTACP